jgi:glycosyltransferase involved in cell wall biosynthesis
MATPVVSSRIGAEGLQLVSGRDLVVVDRAEDMAANILHAIRRTDDMAEMAEQGRGTIVSRYSWDRLTDQLEGVWGTVARNSTFAIA